MRYFVTVLLIGFLSITGRSQEVIGLKNNRVIESYEAALQQQLPRSWQYKPTGNFEKEACDPHVSGVSYLLPNETLTKDVGFLVNYFIDSLGVLHCDNCDILNFGSATMVSDTILYTANDGVVSGMDTLRISYCQQDLDTCYFSITYNIQVNRKGQHYFPPTVNLMPEETSMLSADPNLLTGDLFCSEFIECEKGDYQGRGQRKYFTTYDEPDPNFIYEASRMGGTDSICLRMCDVNAVCDTFHFSVAVAKTMIQTPFMDDFSKETPITDETHWLDREVFLNNTIGQNPPSIGVATFDGVDLRGHAYGDTYGRSDRLTSNYIDFNGVGNYYLSYWLQPKGLGDRPEVKDSLVVEFRKENGEWEQVASHLGVANNVPLTAELPFEFYSIPIPDSYEYDGFQFRFVNFSDRQGMNDIWNLDYVRLDLTQGEPFFDDVAFTKPPIYVLENYRSMPWRHLQGRESEELANSIDVGLFNMTNEALNVSPTSINISEEITGQNILSNITLLNGLEQNVSNQEPNNRSFELATFPSGNTFQAGMEDPILDGHDRLVFNTTYTLSNTSQVSGQGYEDVHRNDEVVQSTVFDNYFAYDDGTAEAAIIATQGHQIAVEYETAGPDELQAVQFFFPHLSAQSVEDQQFILKIWVETLDDEPEYSHVFTAYPADLYYDTLQGFTTYPIVDDNDELAPFALPAGKFYVGWEQKDACQSFYCIGIGYDRNNENAKSRAYTYDNGEGIWKPQASYIYEGAIMMRPVVGNEGLNSTAVKENNLTSTGIHLSPNPANKHLNISFPSAELSTLSYVIYNHYGQKVASNNKLDSTLDISDLPEGFYYIEVLSPDHQRWIEKFVVVR